MIRVRRESKLKMTSVRQNVQDERVEAQRECVRGYCFNIE